MLVIHRRQIDKLAVCFAEKKISALSKTRDIPQFCLVDRAAKLFSNFPDTDKLQAFRAFCGIMFHVILS
jgi:hypothetical protein